MSVREPRVLALDFVVYGANMVILNYIFYPFRRPGEEEEEEDDAPVVSLEARAAKAIQNCWRSRVSRSIYRYYRQDDSQLLFPAREIVFLFPVPELGLSNQYVQTIDEYSAWPNRWRLFRRLSCEHTKPPKGVQKRMT